MASVSHTWLGVSSTFWLNVCLLFLQLTLACYCGQNATQSTLKTRAHTHTHAQGACSLSSFRLSHTDRLEERSKVQKSLSQLRRPNQFKELEL